MTFRGFLPLKSIVGRSLKATGTAVAFGVFLGTLLVPAVQAVPADGASFVDEAMDGLALKTETVADGGPVKGRSIPNPFQKFVGEIQSARSEAEASRLAHELVDAYNAPAAASDDDQGRGAPSFSFQDYRPACDINHDGKNDMFDTGWGDWYRGNFRTYTKGVSGDNGRVMWQVDNGPYLPGNVNLYTESSPPADGLPLPEYFKPTNWDPAETDVNGDGICDVMVLGTDGGELLLPPTPWLVYFQLNFHISMLNGDTGREIWRDDYHLKVLLIAPRFPVCGDLIIRMENIPTGLDHFLTDVGPRYALQLTNWTRTIVRYQCPVDNRPRITDHHVEQNISVFNSSTDHRLWSRALFYNTVGNPTFTYFRGVSDLMGEGEHGPEKELLLDRYDMLTGYCILKTLRGRDGGDFWELPYDDTQAQRGAFANFEEEQEGKIWCLSYFRPDMTGDGIEDVIGTFFTKVSGISTTLNGAFRTHIVPIYGHNGKKMWHKDIRTQGWGYAHPLDVRSAPRADPAQFLFVGTVDPPDRGTHPGGRFPHEGIHMNVLNLTSGSPLGFFEEDYALDTYLIWDLALAQHWDPTLELINDDVVLDPLTPAIYMKPSGAIQVLLSTQQHTYHSLDGTSADPVSDFIAWSGQGQVVNCHNDDGTATVISGHSRRLDVTRFDIQTGQTLWRRPIYNSTLWRSMTRGGEIIFLSAICQDTPDGRTMFAFNMNGFDPRYGQNIISLHGYVGNDSLDWVLPELNGRPPLESSLKIDFLLYAPEKEPSVGQKYFMAFTPVIPGLAVGLGLSMAVNRSVRRRNQK